MPRKLKVFAAPIGFHETVVATPSRAAAQRAWGVHQDLFKAGVARETDDPAAAKAALARPGIVLRRPLGAKGAFTPAADTRRVAKKPKASARIRTAPPATRTVSPPPDRTELSHAEAALNRLVEEHRAAQAAWRDAAAELAARRHEGEARFAAARRQAQQAISDARRRYRSTGRRGAD